MKHAAWILLVASTLGPFALSQTSDNLRPLSFWKATQINGPLTDSVALPVKCDASGNILTRLVDSSDIRSSGVLKIFADGSKTIKVAVGNVPDIKNPSVIDFASAHNQVYVLVRDQDGASFVLKYDSDGQLLGKTKPDHVVRPTQIAVFNSGDFLLAGTYLAAPGSDRGRRDEPFLGLFRGDGKLASRIRLTDDVQHPAGAGGSATVKDRGYQFSLDASVLVIGDDGQAYLMRRTSEGPVFRISPAGIVTKTLKLSAPESTRNSGMIVVHGGYIVTEFLKFKPESNELDSVVLKIVNVEFGDTLMVLGHSNARIGSNIACYDGNTLSFLGIDGNSHLQLVKTRY